MRKVVLRVLGSVELTNGVGRSVESIIQQPKRFALLAYLAVSTPSGFRRREALMALLWPELDEEHARGALRKALFTLRQELGEGAIVGRGDDEIRVAPDVVWCDAVAFGDALSSGHFVEALSLYRGELLPGFHVADASAELSHWLDAERTNLRGQAAGAAWRLAEQREHERDVLGARAWALRAAQLEPFDESACRRLIETLDRLGDRSAAIRAYEAFARRLREHLELDPSTETLALVQSLRERQSPELRQSPRNADRVVRDSGGSPATVAQEGRDDARPAVDALSPAPRGRAPARVAIIGSAAIIVLTATVLIGLYRSDNVAAPDDAKGGKPDRADVPPPYSVAVLPFTEPAASKNGGYLTYGVTEEVTNALGRTSGLLVSYAPAAAAFSGRGVPLAEVGRQLRVSSIVVGTIERRNERLRLVMQLANASSGALLWRRTYEVPDRELPSVYSDVAREVRAALAPGSATGQMEAGSAVARTANPRAYQSYLLGLTETQRRSAEGARRALEHFEQAIREDSSYADAFAALAMGFARRTIYREGSTREERIAGVNAAASRALSLDSTSAAAWTALAISRFLDEWDWRGSEAAFRRALSINPSHATAYNFYAQLLVATGRPREGEAALERMRALDPLTSGSSATYGLVLYYLRRYDESAHVLRAVVRGDSSYENGFAFLTRPLLMLGRERELASVMQHQLAQHGWPRPDDALIVARAVNDTTLASAARRVLDRWENAAPPLLGPVQQARIRSRLGDHAAAITLLELAHRTRDPAIYAIGADPAFDLLRMEPRVQAILKAMGLAFDASDSRQTKPQR